PTTMLAKRSLSQRASSYTPRPYFSCHEGVPSSDRLAIVVGSPGCLPSCRLGSQSFGGVGRLCAEVDRDAPSCGQAERQRVVQVRRFPQESYLTCAARLLCRM